ncbi:phosphatidylethanolamine-binding protein [candidate division WWE3 bacterium RIFOXYC1_FULL_39_7]|uniref:Phosphatidylethanolamine-binding protein n=2 Tax=Katanobacteria TaxID=422282 RepID=A0A1F4X714_UNCKA|nr:MAG: phosphatidylethanolamine-binding protein [candidate division WWE3 bacterium RIFOXYC1_FULL_39_7]OGC77474.1 MAG: phosphatidylethanolamine-binding protein [candidate division WWE3 bacterium RIFOXYD1_FULL_39_9]
MPAKYTCSGDDINPPLTFSDVPAGTMSLVLFVDDPDAPFKTWTHWILYDIDPKITEIRENSVPKGAFLGENDFGKGTYAGPCPPVGKHRYFFYLYALDTVLDLDEGATREEIEEAMEGHILDSALPLVGLFEK